MAQTIEAEQFLNAWMDEEAAKGTGWDNKAPWFNSDLVKFATAFSAHQNSELTRELDHFAKQNLDWANTAERYMNENAGLRKRLHHVEQHNQHFERCESAWCHPDISLRPTFFPENPAFEMLQGAVARAEKAESELASLREELERMKGVLMEQIEWLHQAPAATFFGNEWVSTMRKRAEAALSGLTKEGK